MFRPGTLKRASAVPALAALALALFVVAADPGGVVTGGRNAAFDTYQRMMPRSYQDAAVLVVDIDDESLTRIGQWPWSRLHVARLVHRLADAGAAAVAFDVVFSEPDRTAPRAMLAVWDETLNLPDALRQRLIDDLPDPDRLLAQTIEAAGNVVTAFAPKYSGVADRHPALRVGFATAGDDPVESVIEVGPAVSTLPDLEAAAAGNGSIAFAADSDLVVRRLPLLTAYEGQLRPSLALEALRVAVDASTVIVKSTGASGETGGGDAAIVGLKVGPFEVPTDAEGALRLYYTPSHPARTLPAWKVLDEGFDRSAVEGKIIFVGTSAAGLRDLRPSPLDPVMPGVEAHAQAVEQIMAGVFLERPDWAVGLEWLVALGLGLCLVIVVSTLDPRASVTVFAVAMAALGLADWYAWSALRMLLDPLMPAITGTVVFAVGLIAGYVRTDGDRRRVSSAFAHYLSPHLVTELARHPERLKLGGETREMTFLFCDVRGFTRVSEALKDDPQGLTRLINRFLTPLSEEILERGGTIDKYMGDCIMAFWNAPLDQPDHADRACAAALAMMAALEDLNAELAAEADAAGRSYTPLAVGIGVNSGTCVVGNMGSNQRFDYSVLGDAVNLASRLEGQSKTYGVDIVIGERTRALAPDWTALELDLIAVKGKAEAVKIHALLGPPEAARAPDFAAHAEAHAALIAAYRSADPDASERHLEACRAARPELSKTYALYAARIEAMRADPPPADWDGVYVARTK